MHDTTPRQVSTPAEVAAAILDNIEARPDAFNMYSWFSPTSESELDFLPALSPDDAPECGTTMCVAGWAAHLTGWTLRGASARRNGEHRYIEHVGRDALGLIPGESDGLLWASPDEAIEALGKIAGR